MIYLRPEVASGLGEDTFWTWFKREVKNSSFDLPKHPNPNDVVLQYSTAPYANFPPRQTITLLWELYPEMKSALNSNEWDGRIETINDAAQKSVHKVVASQLMVPSYSQFGQIDVVPIGVNTELFKPLPNKESLKRKYNIPLDKRIGFWSGTTHRMKGYDKLLEYSKSNPDIYWIIVWKQSWEASHFNGGSNYCLIPQTQIAELMNCADFFLSCGRLRPFFMIEWEAMACDLKPVILDNMQKDFVPSNNPRADIIKLGWSRLDTKHIWLNYIRRKMHYEQV